MAQPAVRSTRTGPVRCLESLCPRSVAVTFWIDRLDGAPRRVMAVGGGPPDQRRFGTAPGLSCALQSFVRRLFTRRADAMDSPGGQSFARLTGRHDLGHGDAAMDAVMPNRTDLWDLSN